MDNPKYLKHLGNGRVLPWTEILAERGDMIPCDVHGNPLSEDCVMSVNMTLKSSKVIRPLEHTSGLGDPKNRKRLEQVLDKELKNVINEKSSREASPYDGVMGVPPGWVPDRDRDRFIWARNLLLNNYTQDEVLECLELWPKYIEGKLQEPAFARMHREIIQAIDYLSFMKQAIDAGPIVGLRMLAGGDAACGYKVRISASKGGESRRLNYSEENERINETAKQIVVERNRKPGQRELARLVVRKLYPCLPKDAVEKKVDAVRKRLKL